MTKTDVSNIDKYTPKRRNMEITAFNHKGTTVSDEDPAKYHGHVHDQVENKATTQFVKKHNLPGTDIVKSLVNDFSRVSQAGNKEIEEHIL